MDEDGIIPILIGVLIGMVFTCIIFGIFDEDRNNTKELGKSICEEEYGMDFESYYKGTLKCKPFTESYDGIQIEINERPT